MGILNINVTIDDGKEVFKRFFSLSVRSKDSDYVKLVILNNIEFDSNRYKIIKEEMIPSINIEDTVKYYIKMTKK